MEPQTQTEPAFPESPRTAARPWPELSRRQRVAAAAAGWVGAPWLRSLRIEVLDLGRYLALKAQGKAVILAVWHAQMLMVTPLAVRYHTTALVSPTADGELGQRVAHRLGIATVRGDSRYRPGQALMALAHNLRRGTDISLFPDGPLGPPETVKPGLLSLAALTGCPIVPLGAAAGTKLVAQASWDRFQVPLPGSRVAVAVGEPMHIPRSQATSPSEQHCLDLQAALGEQTRRATAHLAPS